MTASTDSRANLAPIKKVRKAVLPAAGFGTRFLPATKAQPKEMLNVVDKPQIQYVVEECIASGIEHIIIVTGKGKSSIEDHFDFNPALERFLEEKGKHEQAAMVHRIGEMVQVSYTRQKEPLGLGHAVLVAKDLVGDEPFAVLLADDLIDATPPVMQQMIEAYEKHNSSVLGVQNVPRKDVSQYGIVASEPMEAGVHKLSGIVEKPRPEDAPSTLGVVGRYILKPRIFHCLENIAAGAGGEIQLTDGIAALLHEERVLACEFRGVRYDCGNKLGYLQATVAYGLKHKEVGAEFAAYLKAQQKT